MYVYECHMLGHYIYYIISKRRLIYTCYINKLALIWMFLDIFYNKT